MTQDKIILLIVGVVAFLTGLVINLAIDYKKILDEGRLSHKGISHWVRKAAIMSASVVMFALATNAKWFWALGFSSAMVALWFYLLFDIILNVLRGFKWYYTGTPDEWDSGTEKIESHLPAWSVIAFKCILIFVSTFVYIKLLD